MERERSQQTPRKVRESWEHVLKTLYSSKLEKVKDMG